MIFLSIDDQGNNVPECNDVNNSGIKRFTISPLTHTLERYNINRMIFDEIDTNDIVFDKFKNRKKYKNYIVATGVTHSPQNWTGNIDLNKKYEGMDAGRYTIFHYIHAKLLNDLRKGKAYLLLDQSHEGYHVNWLFQWFHDACNHYNINPNRIIYVTGNLAVKEQYNTWCVQNNIDNKLTVIPYIHFETFIYDSLRNARNAGMIVPELEDQISYKTKNIDKIKTYNCFQKRPRPHRVWMFSKLQESNLLEEGINSMNEFAFGNARYEGKDLTAERYIELQKLTPMYPRDELTPTQRELFKSPMGGEFEQDLYWQEINDSWVSVVSEASFAEDTCFISEKTFKPIATRHPFIMCGNKNSLKYLKELGYKTFDGFIDESYDSLDTWERFDAIINEILKIKNMSNKEKLDWLSAQKDILDHNYKVLEFNSTKKLPEPVIAILNLIKE
jgi:hypothetical protein